MLLDEFSVRDYDFMLTVRASESDIPTLLNTTSFLYDLNLAYELARLATDEVYSEFVFSGNALRRNGRPLQANARLRVVHLRQQSPLELVTAVAAVGGALGAIWVLVQIFEKVYNIPMNRQKLRAEVEKLERENRVAARSEQEKIERERERRAEKILYDSAASPYLDGVSQRLSRTSIVIKQVEIEIVKHRDQENDR